ncbi:MAG: hypothetical protein KF746_04320 [Chitinophagaceae bacterium]|nr:hypothetical protein [Chitinophagaceae bacterium]
MSPESNIVFIKGLQQEGYAIDNLNAFGQPARRQLFILLRSFLKEGAALRIENNLTV